MLWKKFQPLNGYYVVKIEEYIPTHETLVLNAIDNVARILEVPDEWVDQNGIQRKPTLKKGQLVLFSDHAAHDHIDEEDDDIVLMHEERIKGIIKE